MLAVGVLFLAATGCSDAPVGAPVPDLGALLRTEGCTVPSEHIASGASRDAIPSLTDPAWVGADEADYLHDDDLVIGLVAGSSTYAIPHNILWWHEVVNLTETDPPLAISFCPLTGSSLAFDRSAVQSLELGVSGLLYRNNLLMYDRAEESSLWSQMGREAVCGPLAGQKLPTFPIQEMTWAAWKSFYPGTQVVSGKTGHDRNYSVNPYGRYVEPENTIFYFPLPEARDERLPPKTRVLGIPLGEAPIVFSLDDLHTAGRYAVVAAEAAGQPIVVFYDAEARTANAFWLRGADAGMVFTSTAAGITDLETGSRWNVLGRAVEGELAGRQLLRVQSAYIAYWFAWASFFPASKIGSTG